MRAAPTTKAGTGRPGLRGIAAVLVLALLGLGQAAGAQPGGAEPIIVNLRLGSTEPLSLRLYEALHARMVMTPALRLSGDGESAPVVLTVPHIDWGELYGRVKVVYDVELTRPGAPRANQRGVRHLRGSCWDDEIDDCAQQIVNQVIAQGR
ncbi:MAG: hypothetical protein U1E50_05045 [Caulobacteraceae bacterium]